MISKLPFLEVDLGGSSKYTKFLRVFYCGQCFAKIRFPEFSRLNDSRRPVGAGERQV